MTDVWAFCGSEHCITCGDDGVAMTVLSLDAGPGLAWCTADDAAAEPTLVEIALVDGVTAGARILVHAGTAIAALGGAR